MHRCVALLRAINVGGNRSVPMAALRTSFETAGATDVSTYIQSGNVIFTPPPTPRGTALESHLEARLRHDLGLEIPVLVRSADELERLIAHNPFPGTEGTKLVVYFVRSEADATTLASLDPTTFAPESLAVHGRELLLSLPGGQARSPLVTALGKVRPRVDFTARNWNTVVKLHQLATA